MALGGQRTRTADSPTSRSDRRGTWGRIWLRKNGKINKIVCEVAAVLVAQHMTYVEKPGQKAAADLPFLSQNAGESSLCYHGNHSLLIIAFIGTSLCVFRLLAETPLDSASLVHTSSPFQSLFVFEFNNNKQRLKTSSCGAVVYFCHIANTRLKDRFDRSSAVSQQKLAQSFERLWMVWRISDRLNGLLTAPETAPPATATSRHHKPVLESDLLPGNPLVPLNSCFSNRVMQQDYCCKLYHN